MSRRSHTTKHGKAKCLAYHNGKRCGRVAKIVGTYHERTRTLTRRQSLCRTCATRLNATIQQTSAKGFRVVYRGFITQSRDYEAIE